jgi:putative oxidoreductase
MYPSLLLQSGWGLLFLRVAFGAVLVAHGFPKLKKLKETSANFSNMGFRPGALWGTLIALLESFGGIAVILGFMTVCVSALFIVEFLVIVIWKLAKRGAFVNGWEFDLLLLAVVVMLFFSGAGMISLDYLWFV